MEAARYSMLCALVLVAGLVSAIGLISPADAATFSVIHSFCTVPTGCVDGEVPVGTLVMDQAGNLYGTTLFVGAQGNGVVFELTPVPGENKWKERVLYNFCAVNNCADGTGPVGALIVDTLGNLYGTTSDGGSANNKGTIFELSPIAGTNRWSETVLYSFCSNDSACTDGSHPAAGLTYHGAAAGAAYDGTSTLYGTAATGGRYASGTAFTFRPSKHGGWVERPIYAFCAERREACADGSSPNTRLLVGSTGTLYGTTADGGANEAGTVFKLTSNSGSELWSLTVLHSFCSMPQCADGQYPSSAVVMDNAGNLFGATTSGGNGASCPDVGICGTIYTVSPNGGESVVYNFCSKADCRDGSDPIGDLAANGTSIFGTTFGTRVINSQDLYGDNLFELTGLTLNVLHAFCRGELVCREGRGQQGVIVDGAGNVFGVSPYGGAGRRGNVFEWSP